VTVVAQADSDKRLQRVSSLWHDLLQSKPSEDLSPYLHGPEFALRFLADELALVRLTNSAEVVNASEAICFKKLVW
jgi:hypothetical protein